MALYKRPNQTFHNQPLFAILFIFWTTLTFAQDKETTNMETTVGTKSSNPPQFFVGKKLIADGLFSKGCLKEEDQLCEAGENSWNEVVISAFLIDENEVTMRQFEECIKDGKCFAGEKIHPACNWGAIDRLEDPVNCVNWGQARDYCLWRGGDLPTALQWEKAAQGTDMRKYPWGNAEPDCSRAIMRDQDGQMSCGKGSSTWPVGARTSDSSFYQVLNMGGNVREWVLDNFISKTKSIDGEGRQTDDSIKKMIKGGCYYDLGSGLRISRVSGLSPTSINPGVGFRCVEPAP